MSNTAYEIASLNSGGIPYDAEVIVVGAGRSV